MYLRHREETNALLFIKFCAYTTTPMNGVNAFMQIICTYIMGLHIMRDACATVRVLEAPAGQGE